MAAEDDPEHVPGLALEPVGGRPDRDHGVDLLAVVEPRLHAYPDGVGAEPEQVVVDREPLRLRVGHAREALRARRVSGRARSACRSSRRRPCRPSRGSRSGVRSERKLKPCSSRRWVHASTMRAASTTSVVSPCASTVSTSPGTPLRTPSSCHRRHWATPRICVGRRHARLDLLVQPDDALHQRLRPRWAPGHVDVDRHDLVDALERRCSC